MARLVLFTCLVLSLIASVICARAKMGSVSIKPLNYKLSDPLQVQLTIFPNGMDLKQLERCSISIEGDNKYYSPSENSLHGFVPHKTISFPIAPKKVDRSMYATDLPTMLIVRLICGTTELLQREELSLETCIFATTINDVYKQAKSPLNIAIVGQLGAGKSSLSNSMLSSVHKDVVSAAVVNFDSEHVTVDEEFLNIALWDNEKQDLIEPKITLIDTVGISRNNYDRETFNMLFHGAKTDVFKRDELTKTRKEIENTALKISELQKIIRVKFPKLAKQYKLFQAYQKAKIEFNNLADKSSDEKQLASSQKKLKSIKTKLLNYKKDQKEDFTTLLQRLVGELMTIEEVHSKKLEESSKELNEKRAKLDELKQKQLNLESELSKKKQVDIEKVPIKNKVHSIIFVVKKNIYMDGTGPAIKDIFKTVIKLGYNPIICVSHTDGNWTKEEKKEISKFFNKKETEFYEVTTNLETKGKVFEVDKLAFEVLHTATSRARDFVYTKSRRRDEL